MLDYAVSDYPNLVTSYSYLSPAGLRSNKVRVNLPIIASVQQTIPNAGAWNVTLYNYRENQRQSLSTALKPKADF
jgi:hypothetical protein